MFKAKDIMQKNVISVTTDTPVFEAITLLVEKGITGLAVVDDDSNLVGILSEKDVLKLLYNLEANSGTVAKYMSPDPICFGEEDSLIDICDCLINNHFRRVPIVADGKVTGIISRKDVIALIMKHRK